MLLVVVGRSGVVVLMRHARRATALRAQHGASDRAANGEQEREQYQEDNSDGFHDGVTFDQTRLVR